MAETAASAAFCVGNAETSCRFHCRSRAAQVECPFCSAACPLLVVDRRFLQVTQGKYVRSATFGLVCKTARMLKKTDLERICNVDVGVCLIERKMKEIKDDFTRRK